MNVYAEVINKLASYNNAKSYLEIGVNAGATFFDINIAHKTGVDPSFRFDISKHINENQELHALTSNEFFRMLADRTTGNDKIKIKYDLVFIDGLHTFKQTLRDFCNVLAHTDDESLIILDDTVPRDPWSALPDVKISYYYRKLAGIAGIPWHGDVYKMLFYLYDFYPEFSFATIIDVGNPFTIVWKTKTHALRKRLLPGITEIENIAYFDFLDQAYVINPIQKNDMLNIIGHHFEINSFSTDELMPKIIKDIPCL